MRWTRVVLALLVGCDGSSAVQRVALEEEASPSAAVDPREGPIEEPDVIDDPHLYDPLERPTAALRVPSASLVPEGAEVGDRFATFEPQDLMTATGRMSPGLLFGPGADAEVEALRADPSRARLVHYPEGDLVSSELEWSAPGEQDGTVRARFVTHRELEDRWYAMEVELDARVPLVGGRAVGPRWVARFRPDSHPVVASVLVAQREDRYVADLQFSERLRSRVPATEWVVRDELGVMDCSVLGPDTDRDELHAVLDCGRMPRGQWSVDFRGPLTTVLGTTLSDRGDTEVVSVTWPAPESITARVVSVDAFDGT